MKLPKTVVPIFLASKYAWDRVAGYQSINELSPLCAGQELVLSLAKLKPSAIEKQVMAGRMQLFISAGTACRFAAEMAPQMAWHFSLHPYSDLCSAESYNGLYGALFSENRQGIAYHLQYLRVQALEKSVAETVQAWEADVRKSLCVQSNAVVRFLAYRKAPTVVRLNLGIACPIPIAVDALGDFRLGQAKDLHDAVQALHEDWPKSLPACDAVFTALRHDFRFGWYLDATVFIADELGRHLSESCYGLQREWQRVTGDRALSAVVHASAAPTGSTVQLAQFNQQVTELLLSYVQVDLLMRPATLPSHLRHRILGIERLGGGNAVGGPGASKVLLSSMDDAVHQPSADRKAREWAEYKAAMSLLLPPDQQQPSNGV